MKAIKKHAAIVAALLLAGTTAGSFAGCARSDYEEKVNTAKTQLYVSNYDGGVGTDWLRDIKARFEADYAEESFEANKKGVQIMIETHKEKATSLDPTLKSAEVFFGEEVPYQELAATDKLLDISDVMEWVLAQENVGISETFDAALKKIDNKYYGLPHYETYAGVVYNKLLFQNRALYISKNGGYTNVKADFSPGPDGISGNEDDGLPATMEEFLDLCTEMKGQGITPFILNGLTAKYYAMDLVDGLLGSYGGGKLLTAMMTGEGEDIEVIDTITADANETFGYKLTTKTVDITEENANLLWQTPARFYALCMLKELTKDKKNFEDKGLAGTSSHTEAQELFIKSYHTNQPIAMLMEGNWWENEATAAFNRLNKGDAFTKKNSQFGWMALPSKVNAEDDNNEGVAAFNYFNTYAFVKANIDSNKIGLAKTFLKYCYSEENLDRFTAQTGIARGLTYNISDESYAGLSEFSKQVWNFHKTGTIVQQISTSDVVMNNRSKFVQYKWQSKVDNTTYDTPWEPFWAGKTALDYYNGMKITDADWETLLKD